MSSPLPDLLDPWRAADKQARFRGSLPLARFRRLCGMLVDDAGQADFELVFSRDGDGKRLLRCQAVATVRLLCQRCLGVIGYPIEADSTLAMVSGIEEERKLPECYDPLLLSGSLLRPKDVVEDELLLALPQIPMHDPGDCAAGYSQMNRQTGPQGTSRESGPFAALAGLKSRD